MKENNEELHVYRLGGLTVLQLMGLLAVLGLVLTWILHSIF